MPAPVSPEKRACGSSIRRWAMTEAARPFAQTANAFYRRSVLERLGGFDPTLRIGEDADLSWRMQARLGLEVAFCPSAAVSHQHPETVRELLRQRRGYGYASVVLSRRHQALVVRRGLKDTYRDAVAFARRLGRVATACGTYAAGRLRGRRSWEPVVMAGLDVCTYASWKLGQLQGSLQYRVWYV